MMDKRTVRHKTLLKEVTEKLNERGFIKTPEQAQLKLKLLKQQYYEAVRHNSKSGNSTKRFKFYDLMDKLLGHRPRSSAMSGGVDTSSPSIPTIEMDESLTEEIGDVDEIESAININKPVIKKAEEKNNKYEQSLKTFSSEVKKIQKELQLDFMKEQKELFQQQKQFEMDLQDREDQRSNEFLSGLRSIFRPDNTCGCQSTRSISASFSGYQSTSAPSTSCVHKSSTNVKMQDADYFDRFIVYEQSEE